MIVSIIVDRDRASQFKMNVGVSGLFSTVESEVRSRFPDAKLYQVNIGSSRGAARELPAEQVITASSAPVIDRKKKS